MEKVDKAQGFIEAVKQRRHTLQVTMKAIIDIQRRFFQDGDEADLKPMILKDIDDRTGLDISTISREQCQALNSISAALSNEVWTTAFEQELLRYTSGEE